MTIRLYQTEMTLTFEKFLKLFNQMMFICWILTCSDCLSKSCPKCQNSAIFMEQALWVCCSIKTFATLVLLSLFSISFGSSADYLAYTSYAGLEVQVCILVSKIFFFKSSQDRSTMSDEVVTAMDQLNRYCGGGSYYYRPSHGSGPNLGNLICKSLSLIVDLDQTNT